MPNVCTEACAANKHTQPHKRHAHPPYPKLRTHSNAHSSTILLTNVYSMLKYAHRCERRAGEISENTWFYSIQNNAHCITLRHKHEHEPTHTRRHTSKPFTSRCDASLRPKSLEDVLYAACVRSVPATHRRHTQRRRRSSVVRVCDC